jgi:hypothetical protein
MIQKYEIGQARHSPLRNFVEAIEESNLHYFAQDIRKSIGYSSTKELDDVISVFITSMTESNMDISSNIKFIYRCNGNKLYPDWKLSELALGFLIFNAPKGTPYLRKLQLKILSDYFIINN